MQILQQAFRVYVEIPELENCIEFYEKIQGTRCERRVRDDFAAQLRVDSVTFVHEPRTVTGGRNFTAQHQDGLVMEYFEAEPPKGNRS